MTGTVTKGTLRLGEVGPEIEGTPGDVLTFDTDGRTIKGTTPSAGAVLAPLRNTFWLDALTTTTGPGLPLKASATAAAFATLVQAFAALDPGDNSGRFFFLDGDYSNGGIAVSPALAGCQFPTVEGVAGDASQVNGCAFLPPLVDVAAGPGGTIASLYARNVVISGDVDGKAIFRPQNVFLDGCFTQGTTTADNGVIAKGTTFGGAVIAGQSCMFTQCDATQGHAFDLNNGAFLDEPTLMAFGSRGVTRAEAGNAAAWFLSSPSAAVQITYAAIQDADRTVNAGAWLTQGAIVSRGSLTANRVLTVDATTGPELGFFEVWNWGSGGNTFTVNGTVVANGTHVTFQLQAGVLVPFGIAVLI
jgi:hypothetical protein